MTINPPAPARRNLVQRIARFVRRIEDGFQPEADAMDNLAIALDCLERQDYPTGEDAMMLAEHAWPPRAGRAIEPQPAGALVERFRRLAAGG